MAGLTDIGKKRDLNEDRLGVLQRERLLIVCDGMGGHAAGDVASGVAVETIQDFFMSKVEGDFGELVSRIDPSIPEPARRLVAAIRLANRRVYNLALDNPAQAGMGTTVVAATLTQNSSICIAHVGDSRAYRIRNGEIEQLTEDHSWVAELLEDKEITEEDAKTFQAKNVITRALGTQGSVKIDLRLEPARRDDSYLLCSDGLSGQVSDQLMRNAILSAEGDFNLAVQKLIDLANDAGGPDNITAGVLHALEVPATKPEPPVVKTISEEEESLQEIEDRLLARFYARSAKGRSRSLVAVPALIVVIGLAVAFTYFQQRRKRVSVPSGKELEWVSLEISTEPAGATLFLDGERHPGVTPISVDSLKAGSKLKVRLERTGYQSLEETVELDSSGPPRGLYFNLRPEVVVAVALSSRETKRYAKASLIIDGRDYGELGAIANKDIAIPAGQHVFEIVERGRAVLSVRETVSSGSILDIMPDEDSPNSFVLRKSPR